MDHCDIVMGLIGVLFVAIIGVYIWVNKISERTNAKLGDIYTTINKHMLDSKKHCNSDDLVLKDVCKVVHENLETTVNEIKADIKTILEKVSK